MRVALVRPLYRTPRYDPEIEEPLGLEALSAFLRSYGHQVLLVDLMLTGQSEDAAARRAAAFRPDAAGFSAMSRGDLESIEYIAKRLAGGGPTGGPNLAVGGSFISTQPHTACELLPPGTACISYEGERPFVSLLDAWNAGRALADVPSVTCRAADGSFVSTQPASAIEDLDGLPPPSRDLMDYIIARAEAVNVQGSRGCTGACAYCTTPAFPHPPGKRWRGRTPENIAEEMAVITARWPARTFNFVDDDFLGPGPQAHTRAEAFASAVATKRLRIGFGIQARPSTLTKGAVAALARAGLAYVFLGIENDDASVLGKWGRPQKAEAAWEAIDRLREYRIEAQAGCIMFHPDATLESIRRLAVKLSERKLLNYRTASNRLQLLPKSKAYEDARKSGDASAESTGPVTPGISARGVEELHRLLLEALEPMRPAWLHGACVFPNVIAAVRADANADTTSRRRLGPLRAVLSELDNAVETTLFALLDAIDSGRNAVEETQDLRRRNLRAAEAAVRELARSGIVESYETLREAIRKDCGL